MDQRKAYAAALKGSPLDIGRSMIGRTEKEAATGGAHLDPETQAWCTAFVSATLRKAGMPVPKNDTAAMSYKNYGDPVVTPREGDIGVFARHDDPKHTGWEGHTGFFEKYDQYGDPVLLSGNAQDMVMDGAPY